jgi:hypothetical protein
MNLKATEAIWLKGLSFFGKRCFKKEGYQNISAALIQLN